MQALLDRSQQYVTPIAVKRTPIDVDLLSTPLIDVDMFPPSPRPLYAPINPTPPFVKRVRKCASRDLYTKGKTMTPDTKAEMIKVQKKLLKKDEALCKALTDICDDESVQDLQEALAYLRMIDSPAVPDPKKANME